MSEVPEVRAHVYAARKRKCPFCGAPIWVALTTERAVVVLGQNPAKETAYQHRCQRSGSDDAR